MAASSPKACVFYFFISAIYLHEYSIKCDGLMSQNGESLEEMTIVDLQKSIVEARHHPACVLFQEQDARNKLEQKVSSLWKSESLSLNLSSWHRGRFPINKYEKVPVDLPDRAPTLRCYLSSHHSHDFSGKTHNLHHWFQKLLELHSDRFPQATRQLVDDVTQSHDLTLLTFLAEYRHFEVENVLYDVRENWPEVGVVVVHPKDAQAVQLARSFNVTVFPTTLFLNPSKRRGESVQVREVLQGYEARRERIEIYLHAHFSPALHITQENFSEKVLVKSKLYVPLLLLLYTGSLPSLHHLIAFNRAVSELQETDVHMRFGVLEVCPASRQVVQNHIQSAVKVPLPHTVLFRSLWKKTTVVGIEQLVISERPTPLTLLDSLHLYGALIDKHGEAITIDGLGATSHFQFSLLTEGPYGSICTPYSHNATDSDPIVVERPRKVYIKKKKRNWFGTWHDRYASENMDAALRLEGSIPVVTEDTWSGVVEKSHAPLHPFYPGQKWRGEVTKVALVVFIIGDCGSCRRNMPVFEDLHKAVKFVDGGSLYLANCTSDPILCAQHNVTGFPTLIAYRGLGWMETSECMPQSVRVNQKHVRLDYHGVITEKAVMEWFTFAAGSAVTNSRFSHLHVDTMAEDSHLVATLIPKESTYLPRVANKRLEYFYSYECYRLACELLYGQVPCYVQYSTEIPHAQFKDEDRDMVVTTVSLHRRDGVWSTITKLGRTLAQTLQEESASNMYTFHQPHSYELPSWLRCEDDHARCTGVIVDFTLDHSRLPVTRMSSHLFHTRHSLLFYENTPILIAFVYADNITDNAPFQKSLLKVAYEVYHEVVVVAVDVEEYAYWSGLFVPRNYGVQVYDMAEEVFPALYVYPRLCMVQWSDHRHAAFYPPVTAHVSPQQPYRFSAEGMLSFVREYLQDPSDLIMETEHF